MVLIQPRQQALHRIQRLFATLFTGDGNHLVRTQAMLMTQHRQQARHRLQGLLAAIMAGDGHHLVQGQAIVVA